MPPGWPKLSQAGVGYAHPVCLAWLKLAINIPPRPPQHPPTYLPVNLQTIRPTKHPNLPSEPAS